MSNFDWKSVYEAVNTKKVVYDYDQYGHLFQKVALDMYKPKNAVTSQLWELRDGEDGKQYLFAVYEDPEDIIAQSSDEQKKWEAKADSKGENVTLSYKKVPVYRFASSVYKFDSNNAVEFASFIEKKACDKSFVDSLLQKAPGISDERRVAVKQLIEGEE